MDISKLIFPYFYILIIEFMPMDVCYTFNLNSMCI